MPTEFEPSQIVALVDQLGGDRQRARQQLQGIGQVDPHRHAALLDSLGVDAQKLLDGGYRGQLDAQRSSDRPDDEHRGGDVAPQTDINAPERRGGFERVEGQLQGGYQQGGGAEQQGEYQQGEQAGDDTG